jgi:hypothetical protein
MIEWIKVVGLVFGFLGPLIMMMSREMIAPSSPAGSVQTGMTPRWAHYTGWGFVSLAFILQLVASLCPLISK